MNTGENDNYAPERSDKSAALDLLRRTVEARGSGLTVDQGMGRTFVTRVEYIIRALEIDGLAVIRRSQDGRPHGATLTEFGSYVGERLAAGDLALMPGLGGIKVVGRLKRLRRPPSGAWADAASSTETIGSIVARAPSHYGEDVVSGSATDAFVARLIAWADHPVMKSSCYRGAPVRCAWEVFSREGWSHGLVLETDEGFHGIDAYGGESRERSLPEAAWQVMVNC